MFHKRSEFPGMVFNELGLPLPVQTREHRGTSDGSCGGVPLGLPRNDLPPRGIPELFRHHLKSETDFYGPNFGRLVQIVPAESPRYRKPKETKAREGNQKDAS